MRDRRLWPSKQLTPKPWQSFVADMWQRRVSVLRGSVPPNLPDAAAFFDVLVRAAAEYEKAPKELDFFIGREPVSNARPYLPVAADGSIAGYGRRIEAQLEGRDFTLLVANPHLHFGAAQAALQSFLRWLFGEVGMPAGGVDTAAFVGRYRRTPFGVHRGEMDVMTIPVEGTKNFRAWTSEYATAHPELSGACDYEQHRHASEVISIATGDVGYWPSETWHIAESSEGLTAAWNIGFWWERQPLIRVLDQVASGMLDEDFLANQRIVFPFGAGDDLGTPSSWFDATEAVRAFCNSDALRNALALEWLRMLSAGGFRKCAPERAALSWQASGLVRTQHPILTRHLDAGLAVASNGHVFIVRATPDQEQLLRALSMPDTAHARLDLSSLDGPLRHTVDLLYRVGALDLTT